MFWIFGRRKDNGDYHRVLPFKKVVDGKQVAVESEKVWKCVSLSRSQFTDHYIGLSTNVAMYMQDKEAFGKALCEARDALQSTMLVRLPTDRPREQGAKYEQLWKFTMFACYLLRGASKLNRSWHKKNEEKLLFVDFSVKGLKYSDKESGYSKAILNNLNQLLPVSSSLWLMEDEGKCIAQINRAASGQLCFIDSVSGNGEKTKKAVSQDEPISKLLPESKVVAGSKNIPDVIESVSKKTSGTKTGEKTGAVEHENVAKSKSAVKTAPIMTPKKKVVQKKATAKKGAAAKKKPAGRSKAKKSDVGAAQSDLFEFNDDFTLDTTINEESDVPPKIEGMDNVAAALGIEVNDSGYYSGTSTGIGKATICDETIPDGDQGANTQVADVLVTEFTDWLDRNADWGISKCHRKTFMYQKMVQQYINVRRLDITLAEFGLRLETEGFERLYENSTQLMVVPEVEENV